MLRRQFAYTAFGFVAGFLSAPPALWADDQPSQAEAQQVALKAAAFVKDQGIDAARKTFETDGEFKHGQIYVNVITDKGIRLIYPPAPGGDNIDVVEAQDVDGKFLVKDILDLAKTKGEGWTTYRWPNPVTKKIAEKMTYVKAVPERGAVVYVGIYK
jgi:signal transduction histidine kinase